MDILPDPSPRPVDAAPMAPAVHRPTSRIDHELFFSLALDPLYVGGFDGTFQHVNPAFERTLGYAAAELLGHQLVEFIHPDDQAIAKAEIEQLARGVSATPLVTQYVRSDGTSRHLEWTATPIVDDGVFYAVVRDVTGRKEAERQYAALAQGERLRTVGQMASGVAHDLNQALALVAGYGDLAKQALEQAPPDVVAARDMLATIVQAAYEGGQSIARLLTFVRPQAHDTGERIELGELLQDVAQLTAPRWRGAAQAEGRAIDLGVDIAGDLAVDGSAAALRDVFTNLVFNAVDALPDGGTIRLHARPIGVRVMCEVTDSGIGMTPEVQARIFDPFFTTKGHRGTGLGLAMVHGIVERHGGQIAVESASGRGTTFRLFFPAAPSVAPVAATRVERAATGSLRILVIDDVDPIVDMAVLMLRNAGHDATGVSSGEAALERLAVEPCDVVISDMGLGAGMNGWDVVAAIRARHPNIRIYLATGWGAGIDPLHAAALGVSAVLSKPYRIRDLRRLLEPPTE